MFHTYRTEFETTSTQFESYLFDNWEDKRKMEKPFYVELLQALALLCAWAVIILVLFTKW